MGHGPDPVERFSKILYLLTPPGRDMFEYSDKMKNDDKKITLFS